MTAPIVLALLLAALAMKAALIAVPDVRTINAPGQFDTARAVARLERILGPEVPHPVDSAANDAVRTRLIAELRAIGVTPRIDDRVSCNGGARTISCARVRNVLATVGPAQGRHVLVAVHYDSTPVGPGAADDGIGIAAALEVAGLLSQRTLARPVTFLFDEGEESGLLGARAFLEGDPLAGRVDTLVNMESRGVTGPATMFETNRPNGAAIATLDRADTHVSANSLATDFARMIPNSTDVEVFKARDWTILNFAIIGNETRYHTPGDTLAALDRRSVQHMGDQALAVIGGLATAPPAPAANRVYTDVLGQLVVLPQTLALMLVGVLVIATATIAWRRPGARRGALAPLAAMALAALLVFGLQSLAGLARSGEFWRGHPWGMALAIDATSIAAALLLANRVSRRVSQGALRAGFWLLFLLLGGAICLLAPGGAIFFLAPPALALAGMALGHRWTHVERLSAILAWAALFLSFAPLIALTQILLDFDAAWTFAPLVVLIAWPVLVELSPLLQSRKLLAGAAAAALAGWAIVLALPAYSDDRRQQFGIEYVWDEAARTIRWMLVHDGAELPDAYRAMGDWERAKVPWSTRPRLAIGGAGAAPVPAVRVVSSRAVEGNRQVTLQIAANGAGTIILRAPPEARLIAAGRDGRLRRFAGKGDPTAPWFVRCHGRSCDGARFDIVTADPRPLEWMVIGQSPGLPASAAPLVAARPILSNPQYTPDMRVGIGRVRI